jgi:hypothetical protein
MIACVSMSTSLLLGLPRSIHANRDHQLEEFVCLNLNTPLKIPIASNFYCKFTLTKNPDEFHHLPRMQGRKYEIPRHAGERLVQLGRKEQKPVQIGRKKDRTPTGPTKKNAAWQQLSKSYLTYPWTRMVCHLFLQDR